MKSKDFPDPVLHLGEQSCMCEWTEFLLFTASFFARPLLLQDCFGKGHISVLHLHLFIHESLPVSANRAKCVPLSADAAAAILVLRHVCVLWHQRTAAAVYTQAASPTYGSFNYPGLTLLLIRLGSGPEWEREAARRWDRAQIQGRPCCRSLLGIVISLHPNTSQPSPGWLSSHWIPHLFLLLVLDELGAWSLCIASEQQVSGSPGSQVALLVHSKKEEQNISLQQAIPRASMQLSQVMCTWWMPGAVLPSCSSLPQSRSFNNRTVTIWGSLSGSASRDCCHMNNILSARTL